MKIVIAATLTVLVLMLVGCASNDAPAASSPSDQIRVFPEGIDVQILTAPCFFIRGEVQRPGRYPLRDGITLLQGIATAGGFTEWANANATLISGDQKRVFSIRKIETSKISDPPLRNGDIITVERRWLRNRTRGSMATE